VEHLWLFPYTTVLLQVYLHSTTSPVILGFNCFTRLFTDLSQGSQRVKGAREHSASWSANVDLNGKRASK